MHDGAIRVFDVKHDKLLKVARLSSGIRHMMLLKIHPFGEGFIHWVSSFVGQRCVLKDANSSLLLGTMCILDYKIFYISE